MRYLVLLIPVIGTLTGWTIVSLMLKLLFWPRQPAIFLGRAVQGLIPKKREELANGIGEIIEGQLYSAVSDNRGLAPDILSGLTETVVSAARKRVEAKIPSIIPGGIRAKIEALVEDIIRREIPACVDTMAANMTGGSGRDISRRMAEAIRRYDIGIVESKLLSSPEVLYLKAGASLIGLVSGLIQMLVGWLALA